MRRAIFWVALVVSLAMAYSVHAQNSPPPENPPVQAERMSLAPSVQAVVDSDTPQGKLARAFLRYSRALVMDGAEGVKIEDVVTPDVRCIELEGQGYPPGAAGLKLFRQQMNQGQRYERVLVKQMRFSGPDVIETELQVTTTHVGELLGRAPTGRTVTFAIHTLGRFVGDRLAVRWDRMDVDDFLRQLDGKAAQ